MYHTIPSAVGIRVYGYRPHGYNGEGLMPTWPAYAGRLASLMDSFQPGAGNATARADQLVLLLLLLLKERLSDRGNGKHATAESW